MKQHIVSSGKYTHHFKEIKSIDEMEQIGFYSYDAMQVWHRNGGSVTEFVKGIDLENKWLPYGYGLRFILLANNGAMTAFLFKNPAQ